MAKHITTTIGKDVYTTAPQLRFPVPMEGGFGQVVVDVEPGESKTVQVGASTITVHRPSETAGGDR
jgi:hypothetical protein